MLSPSEPAPAPLIELAVTPLGAFDVSTTLTTTFRFACGQPPSATHAPAYALTPIDEAIGLTTETSPLVLTVATLAPGLIPQSALAVPVKQLEGV